jgi:formate dehydrogenase iron-sulfur subunit
MEADPFQLIEGMTIAALAVGAAEGFIYLRSEYPHARAVLGEALARAGEAGCLGDSVCGSGRPFRIELRIGAGAYICGERPRCWTACRANAAWCATSPRCRRTRACSACPR